MQNMQKLSLAILCAAALSSAVATTSHAAVNCGIVKKDLDLGRKPEDIAERMGISVADVNTCKQQAGNGTIAPTPAGPKPGTPSASGDIGSPGKPTKP